jgi:hypothetical protein
MNVKCKQFLKGGAQILGTLSGLGIEFSSLPVIFYGCVAAGVALPGSLLVPELLASGATLAVTGAALAKWSLYGFETPEMYKKLKEMVHEYKEHHAEMQATTQTNDNPSLSSKISTIREKLGTNQELTPTPEKKNKLHLTHSM